ncbi:dihydrodipicolinate synthase family protein [Emcibacter sp.]|uniref:dihydrodipicolinate synthase family protein n=1 Tax=Emcibacter sp. TaxID=1979954 RepID=UPI002AA6EE8C|nr:dihydrodipicolinate synthase family protein [Emcibacter sp.]
MARDVQEIFKGVFPAVTTQFDERGNVDLEATRRVIDGLVRDGVHGLVLMGTVGENNSLRTEEKVSLLEAARKVVDGRVPILSGVSEFTTEEAQDYVRAAERIGIDGLMVLPAMVYVPDQSELEQHFRLVASATSLPIMLYNNPASYRVSISLDTLARLADVDNIVCIKESAEDTRRFTDLINACGERFIVFAGLDDMAFEGLVLGAKGWVSGLTNAFPRESVALYDLLERGEIEKAREIYRWFMPLLHFDSKPKLVQYIKLAEQVMERGSERVRLPRMILSGAERQDLITTVRKAEEIRPDLDRLSG